MEDGHAFYFTYGTEGQPFYGGWTEVEAVDMNTACRVFRGVHPDRTKGFLNCCAVYDEEQFRGTSMYRDGNYGFRCHERITFSREVFTSVNGVRPSCAGQQTLFPSARPETPWDAM